ncbi:hypothetical protein DM860_014917 [Cuscuta australis]|uniref:Aluminum-activated malate transporter n=1 Tax=Cuscuta australis TaxID=267555 RepID=A0A328E3H1_9ASTE|nr:hypothetical protein DM860_014917 [Cuscuta australis]
MMMNKYWCSGMGSLNNGAEAIEKQTKILAGRVRRMLGLTWDRICSVGREDPRRVVHAVKVGLSLTLVSLLYLVEPLFKEVGQNAIWAVMTVVVVLEFTAGATLYKGLNRGAGTLMAGSLAFFIEYVTTESDRILRAIFIGSAVFLLGAITTYMRFFPYMRKHYDYGLVIFMLTFNLITVSSYRVDHILKMAQQRVLTIVVGCAVCLLMSLLVFPNWSGEDLHNSTVGKFDGLANSIEECVKGYFSKGEPEIGPKTDSPELEDQIGKSYKAVLDSKSIDESLALYASWEPRHSLHCHKFPWQRYVKLGDVLRHFAYTVVALHGCLQTEIQTPPSLRGLFKDPCMRLAGEVSKALRELGNSIRNRRHCSPEILSDNLDKALQDLNSAIKSQPRLFLGRGGRSTTSNNTASSNSAGEQHVMSKPASLSRVKTDTSALMEWKKSKKEAKEDAAEKRAAAVSLRPTLSKVAMITSLNFSEALPLAAFASLLVELVARLEIVMEEVEELGRIAHFEEFNDGGDDDGVITISDHNNGEFFKKPNKKESAETALQNQLPSQAM